MATAHVIPGMRGSPRETGSSTTNHRVHGGTPRAQVCHVLAVPRPDPGRAAGRDAGCPGGAGVPARAAAAAGAAVPASGGPAARGARRWPQLFRGRWPLITSAGSWCAKSGPIPLRMIEEVPRGPAASRDGGSACAESRAASTRSSTCSRAPGRGHGRGRQAGPSHDGPRQRPGGSCYAGPPLDGDGKPTPPRRRTVRRGSPARPGGRRRLCTWQGPGPGHFGPACAATCGLTASAARRRSPGRARADAALRYWDDGTTTAQPGRHREADEIPVLRQLLGKIPERTWKVP